MSVRPDRSRPSESRLSRELEDGRAVDIEITGSPENKKRIDVRVERSHHWVFAVQEDVAVLIMTLNEIGSSVSVDLPTWMEPLIRQLGLEGVEKA